MITGDHLLIAVETAKLLNLGDTVYGTDVVEPLIRTAEGREKYLKIRNKADCGIASFN